MKTNAISHPRAITTIREPIHGAIDVTCFEREVIDSPYFQRLHFVLQNSTTYTAYPSNKNSRFVHSLGVSAVTGAMFVSSLRNSPKAELIDFLLQAASAIHEHSVDALGDVATENANLNALTEGWKATIFGHSGFSHRSFLKAASEPLCESDLNTDDFHGFEIGFIVDSLWEACRMCGLIHDIGHLPMSHSFEMALKRIDGLKEQYPDLEVQSESSAGIDDHEIVPDLVKKHHKLLTKFSKISQKELANFLYKDIAVHERRGLRVLQYIWDRDSFGCNAAKTGEVDIGPYRRLIFSLTTLILYASSTDKLNIRGATESMSPLPKFPAFIRVLKTIIAGEVDGDRMDYTIRDGHACGSEIGTFDIDRVISNAVLKADGDRFRIMYYERAISGLEHFFTQRHDGYKYLIYHRTSSRTEACLQELLGRLLHASIVKPTSDIAIIMEDFGYLKIAASHRVSSILPFSPEAMESLDDANLRTMFMFMRKKLTKWTAGEEFSGLPHSLIWPIDCLLDIVTVRDFDSIMSPFKNYTIQRQLSDLAKTKAEKDNAKYQFLAVQDDGGIEDMLNDALSSSSQPAFTTDLRVAFSNATSDEAVLLMSFQKPKVFAPEKVGVHDWLYVVEHSGEIAPLTDRSRLLANMSTNLSGSSGVSMAIVSKNVKASVKKMDDLRRTLNTILLDALVEYRANSTAVNTERG